MARVFPPYTNTIARFSLMGLLLGGVLIVWGWLVYT
jgi:hypothetical protein